MSEESQFYHSEQQEAEQIYEFEAQETDEKKRLDSFLSSCLPDFSRSFIQKNMKEGHVLINGKPGKASYKLFRGDKIILQVDSPRKLEVLPENIPLDILYEDLDIIVINKPKQMVVHPAPGHYSGTVVNALLYHCKDTLSGINGVMRPGIVHRIDQDTTGAIVICKNDYAHQFIAQQLKEHSIKRAYHAIVLHHLKENGTVSGTIGRHPVDRKKMAVNVKNGREATTHYRILDELNRQYTYIECTLETGRTHQIRVHMSSIGHPVLGDQIYGPSKCPFSLTGQVLHAKTLGFVHPRTKEYMEFDAPLPEYFQKLLYKLSGN